MIVQNGQQAELAARELGGAAVLRMLSEEIRHKRDVSGVAVDVAPDRIADRLDAMASEVECHTSSRPLRFLVQEMVSGETKLILGMYAMPLGRLSMLGTGGVTAGLFKDTTMRLLPAAGGLPRSERWP